MSAPLLHSPDGAFQLAPVGAPIESVGHQVLRVFVEAAPASSAFRVGDELALRAPIVQERWDAAAREERVGLLARERETIALLYPALQPELIELALTEGEPPARVLAHRWVKGQTLERHLQAAHPVGAPLTLGLTWMRSLATALDTLHEARLVHRNLNPKNVLITDEGEAMLFGFASVQPRTGRPSPLIVGVDERYSAPEIMKELSGTFITPKADVFSFGGVMAFVFSGIPLTEMAESPISVEAWSRMSKHPDGVRLLIAHCMQPLHKNRVANASKLLPLLQEDALPTKFTKDFGAIYLAAPWIGGSEESPVGNLSPGPLVSRMGSALAAGRAAAEADANAAAADATEAGDTAASNANAAAHPDAAAEEATPSKAATPSNDAPFWHRPEPDGRAAETSDAMPRPSEAPKAPFFARRGIPPLTIVFITLILALIVLIIANFAGRG